MTTTYTLFSLPFTLALTGALAAQAQTELTCSYDTASPEVAADHAAAGDVGAVRDDPRNASWLSHAGNSLGLPAGGELDALATGFSYFTPDGWQSFDQALCYSVDRVTAGVLGGTVEQQVQGDGAACDVFRIDWPNGFPDVQFAIDCPQLTQLPGPGQTDIDALRFETGFPVFYSVDPASAAALGGLMGMPVTPADILWVPSPGAPPTVFRSRRQLGLVEGDDIDALAVGPQGFLFSLTRDSTSAIAVPAVGGAGLFINGPNTWASAADMGLLDTDELNALAIETMEYDYSHTPLLSGGDTAFRVSNLPPGHLVFLVGTLRPPQQYCVPGFGCLEILPDIVMGTMGPTTFSGRSELRFHIPATILDLPLSTQCVAIGGPNPANWIVMNSMFANIAAPWGWQGCTRGAAVNGYTVVSPRGYHRVRLNNVRGGDGQPLNGDYWVRVQYTVGGTPGTVKKKVTFTNGNADVGTSEPTSGGTFVPTNVGVSLPPH